VPDVVIEPPDNPLPAVTVVTVPEHCVIAVHFKPEVQAESAVKNWPLMPTVSAVGVLAAVAARMSPFAVKAEGAITQAESKETVPLVVIVPPERPVPAVIEVTVPDPPPPAACTGTHAAPSQALSVAGFVEVSLQS
jgi:hypothetical protein